MLIANLKEAVQEAEAFLKLAKNLPNHPRMSQYTETGTKESAALRRKSMDLTRSLSKLRNERYGV